MLNPLRPVKPQAAKIYGLLPCELLSFGASSANIPNSCAKIRKMPKTWRPFLFSPTACTHMKTDKPEDALLLLGFLLTVFYKLIYQSKVELLHIIRIMAS